MQEAGKKQKSEKLRNIEGYSIQGALLLSSVLAADLAAALCRIPLANLLGAESCGIFGNAAWIFLAGIFISSFGIPAATAKLVSSRMLSRQINNAFRVFLCALAAASLAGLAFALIFWFGADALAAYVAAVPESAFLLRIFAPGVLIAAITGAVQGYFLGTGSPATPAIACGIERICGAAAAAAGIFCFPALLEQFAPENADTVSDSVIRAAGSAVGWIAGAACALIFLLPALRAAHIRTKKRGSGLRLERTEKKESILSLFKALILTAVPLFAALVPVWICTPLGLAVFSHASEALGFSADESMVLTGVFTMKYDTMISIPTVIACGFGAATIPGLAAAYVKDQKKALRFRYNQALRLTAIVSVPAWMTLTVFATPLTEMLFHDPEPAAELLLWGSSAVIFYGISSVSALLLQTMGHPGKTGRNAAISLAAFLAVLCVILFGFQGGLSALAAANAVFSLVYCVLNHFSLKRICGFRISFVRNFVKPAASAAVAAVVSYALYLVLELTAGGRYIPLILSLTAGAVVYIAAVLKLNTLSRSDILLLPAGEVFFRLFQTLHLLPRQEKDAHHERYTVPGKLSE